MEQVVPGLGPALAEAVLDLASLGLLLGALRVPLAHLVEPVLVPCPAGWLPDPDCHCQGPQAAMRW